jgi:pimeloyl-ACP methyl ester carboxylesterase
MASWGIQTRLDDFKFIRDLIAAEHGSVKPVVGGVSLGGLTALAAVNQDPNAYAGVILIEAGIAPLSDSRRASHHDYCSLLRDQLNLGKWFDSDSAALGMAVLQLSLASPDATSPFFPPATNRQAYLLTLGTPSPGPPYSPFPAGLVLVTTSVSENRLLVASENLTASQILNANFFIPTAEVIDATCALGGERTFSNNLGAFTGPVLAFEAELGLGKEMQSTLGLLGSRNIQVHFDPGFGHADLFYHPDHATRLEGTILQWLQDTEGD